MEEVMVAPVEEASADAPLASAPAAYSPPKPPPAIATCGRSATSGTASGGAARAATPGPSFPHPYARVFWRTNDCTRFQASAEASANSVCLRSKKLCGAPG
jgi:hypothetical protein